MKPATLTSSSGFTLMEMVVAILLLSIAAATAIVLYGGLFKNYSSTEQAQQGAMLVQSCVENIIGLRQKASSFSSFVSNAMASPSSTSCSPVTALHNSGTLTLSVTASTPQLPAPPCSSSSVNCIKFVINTKNGNIQTSPDTILFFANH